MATIDATHDPSRRSWVESANVPDTDFPIQNLPYGVFVGEDGPRLGVAIGDAILDLRAASDAGFLDGLPAATQEAFRAPNLNAFLAAGKAQWGLTRRVLGDLLDTANDTTRQRVHLVDQASVEMAVPATIGDYTDFYCSIHHATNVGSMFRPDNPLMPNYTHLPVGYHGRASSIVASPAPVRRPVGQIVPRGEETPVFAPSRLLDYELEMGVFVGPGNPLGTRVTLDDVEGQLFGLVIVNDWSARDVQKWEYQPLGPFNAKNFATTVSPWVVTMDALAPFRVAAPARRAGDPPVLDYLAGGPDDLGLDITLAVDIASPAMRDDGTTPYRISTGSFRHMYWTLAQMLVHHTSTGCNLRPGDLIASGTVSGPEETSRGCLLERTWRGENKLALPDGTERAFLLDGDEVTMTGWAEATGARRIGFGACRGVITPADTRAGAGYSSRAARVGS